MGKFFKKIFKKNKTNFVIHWKHSFNDTLIVYPTEKGWEKINDIYDKSFVDEHRTADGGYKDTFWVVMEDFKELFYHGSDYIYSHFEIEERV